jgi:hypothetical protein
MLEKATNSLGIPSCYAVSLTWEDQSEGDLVEETLTQVTMQPQREAKDEPSPKFCIVSFLQSPRSS